ncbi:M23 family metallopeptidase [Candidatus Dependentiae bacterium]|nr:M23 family metallopeptidase [Candidatus Dependentiae bacterium]
MKSIQIFSIVIITIIITTTIKSSTLLTHACAYSNESVARFREQILKKKVINPGVAMDWPIDLCEFWISSLYGMRKNPSGTKMHNGIDMAALKGTDVRAAADGIVKSTNNNISGYGNLIEIEHPNQIITRYAHLQDKYVSTGDFIKKGEIIGKVGSTGNVRGIDPSHLHFEIFINGIRVNPLPYLYAAERNNKNL